MATQKVEELEIKILDINVKDLTSRLKKIGAVKIFDSITYIYCFDINQDINYASVPIKLNKVIKEAEKLTRNGKNLREQNFHLRARKQGHHHEFTMKYRDSIDKDSKIKRETELSVELTESEWNSIKNDLYLARIDLVAVQEKKRLSYKMKEESMQFDIDTWPGIPTYLEIEGAEEDSIKKYIEILGLQKKEKTTASGEELFQRYDVAFYSHLTFGNNKKDVD